MIRLTPLAIAGTLAATGLTAQVGARAQQAVSSDQIHWSYRSHARGIDKPQLRFEHGEMDTSIDAEETPDVFADLARTTAGGADLPVSFSLAREAGLLTCTGRSDEDADAAGSCRFDPNEAFIAALAARKLTPADPDEYLALALVDAHVALVDGLMRLGFKVDDSEKLIALAALHVTPAYAGELRQGGLAIDDTDKLIAARALRIDGEWLGEMAAAGYPRLSADQAIQMRATGVTPEYARKMARVVAATGRK